MYTAVSEDQSVEMQYRKINDSNNRRTMSNGNGKTSDLIFNDDLDDQKSACKHCKTSYQAEHNEITLLHTKYVIENHSCLPARSKTVHFYVRQLCWSTS